MSFGMPPMKWRAILACLLIGLSGCSHYDARSLFNPYISAMPPVADDEISTEDKNSRPALADLKSARHDATTARNHYFTAVRTAAYTRNVGFTALVLATGDALYLRSVRGQKASNRLVTGVAAAGGAAFVMNSALLPRGRDAIYLNGVDAIDCAIAQSSPYVIGGESYDRFLGAGTRSFQAEVRDVKGTLAEVGRQRADLTKVLSDQALLEPDRKRLTALDDELALDEIAARRALDVANAIPGDLQTLRSRLEGAGSTLRGDVRKIGNGVNQQLASIQASDQDLKALISNYAPLSIGVLLPASTTPVLAEPSKPAVTTSGGKAASSPPSDLEKKAAASAVALGDAIRNLTAVSSEAAAFLAEIAKREQIARATTCVLPKLAAFLVTPLGNPSIKPGGKFSILVIAPDMPQVLINGEGITSTTVMTQAPTEALSGHYQIDVTAVATVDASKTPTAQVLITSSGSSETLKLTILAP